MKITNHSQHGGWTDTRLNFERELDSRLILFFIKTPAHNGDEGKEKDCALTLTGTQSRVRILPSPIWDMLIALPRHGDVYLT